MKIEVVRDKTNTVFQTEGLADSGKLELYMKMENSYLDRSPNGTTDYFRDFLEYLANEIVNGKKIPRGRFVFEDFDDYVDPEDGEESPFHVFMAKEKQHDGRRCLKITYIVEEMVQWPKNGKVYIFNDFATKWISMEELMWVTFNGKIPEGQEIRHLDGDLTNNRLDNLYLADKE